MLILRIFLGIGECKSVMTQYLRCIRAHRGTNDEECRQISKQYLQCRMERYVQLPLRRPHVRAKIFAVWVEYRELEEHQQLLESKKRASRGWLNCPSARPPTIPNPQFQPAANAPPLPDPHDYR